MHGEVELKGVLLCLRLPKRPGSAIAVIRGENGNGIVILHSKQEAIDWLVRHAEGLDPKQLLAVIGQLEESMLADNEDPGKPTIEVKGVAGLILSHSLGIAARAPLHPVLDNQPMWWSFDHSMKTDQPTQMVIILKSGQLVETHVVYSQEQANALATRLLTEGRFKSAQTIIARSMLLPYTSTIDPQVFDGFPAEMIAIGAELKRSGHHLTGLPATGDA